jgi:hypothetical protein
LKKAVVFLSVFLLMSLIASPLLAAQEKGSSESRLFKSNEVGIFIDESCTDAPCGHGYVVEGTTYVPIRLIMESLGASVKWDSATRTVHVAQNKTNNEKEPQTPDPLLTFLDTLEFEIGQMLIVDQQLDAAKELYEELSDNSFLLDFTLNKITDKRKRFDGLLKTHTELETDQLTKTHLMDRISAYKQIIDHLDNAAQAYDRYISFNRNIDFYSYSSNRKQALELMDSALRDIREMKQYIGQASNGN